MSDEAGEVSDRRSDAHPSDAHPLILFDGVCNLCNATIQSIIERDGAGRFRFAPLQSRSADTEHESVTGSDQGDFPDSILLVDSVGVHTRSSAAIRIARGLGFPYSLLRLATVVHGQVHGGILARQRLVLEETAEVEGDVHARLLSLKEGGQVNGNINMGERANLESSGKKSAPVANPVEVEDDVLAEAAQAT